MSTSFQEKLKESWRITGSFLCVGLDPDLEKLPAYLRGERYPFLSFCCGIVEATSDLACAYKLNAAFFAADQREYELKETIASIRKIAPKSVIILDAKRGDIGNTAAMYAREAFDVYDADAVTVNPYMGGDTIKPFLERKDRGVIVLCRTSNPGAKDFQDLESQGKTQVMNKRPFGVGLLIAGMDV